MTMTTEEGRMAVEESLSPFERLRRRFAGEPIEKAAPPPPPPSGPPLGPPEGQPEEGEEDEDPEEEGRPGGQRPGAPVEPPADDADGDGDEEGRDEYREEDGDPEAEGDPRDPRDPEEEDEEGEEERDPHDDGRPTPMPPPPPPMPTRKSLLTDDELEEEIDHEVWKSLGDEPDREYLEGLEKSDDAAVIDGSKALIHAVESMGLIVTEAKRIAVEADARAEGLIKSMAEEVSAAIAKIERLVEGQTFLGRAALKSLEALEASEARFVALEKSMAERLGELEKSLGGINAGVELIKSQPAGATSHGFNHVGFPQMGDGRPAPVQRTAPVTMSEFNDLIFKSANDNLITGDQAAYFFAQVNGIGGLAGAYDELQKALATKR